MHPRTHLPDAVPLSPLTCPLAHLSGPSGKAQPPRAWAPGAPLPGPCPQAQRLPLGSPSLTSASSASLLRSLSSSSEKLLSSLSDIFRTCRGTQRPQRSPEPAAPPRASVSLQAPLERKIPRRTSCCSLARAIASSADGSEPMPRPRPRPSPRPAASGPGPQQTPLPTASHLRLPRQLRITQRLAGLTCSRARTGALGSPNARFLGACPEDGRWGPPSWKWLT